MHKPKYNNIEELPSQSPIYLPGQGVCLCTVEQIDSASDQFIPLAHKG